MDRPPSPGDVPPGPPPTWIPATGPPPARKRRTPWAIVAVLCVLALVIGVVVTVALVSKHREDVAAEKRRESAAAKAASESAASAESAASLEARESQEAEELAAAENAYDTCMRNVGPFYDALTEVDARLDVGLSQRDLSGLVGDASLSYNRIRIDDLGDGNCLAAAAKMEAAFNAYNTTVSRWNECIYDYYCDLDDIDPGMQVKWARAARLLDRAGELLDEMDPTSPSYVEGAAGDLTA